MMILIVIVMIIVMVWLQTNGVGTNGVTANFMCFDRLLGYSRLPTFIFPKVPGRTFFPNQSKCITFAATPLVLTPFVRNQMAISISVSITISLSLSLSSSISIIIIIIITITSTITITITIAIITTSFTIAITVTTFITRPAQCQQDCDPLFRGEDEESRRTYDMT